MKNSWCHGPVDHAGKPMCLFVDPPACRITDTTTEVHYVLRLGADETTARMLDTLTFRINRLLDPATIGMEPALAALLPFAMACQWDLVATAPASSGFGPLLDEYARISDAWMDDWRKPMIVIPPAIQDPALPEQRGQAVFFSGGVDSMHLLVARSGQIADAIFLTGFDIEPAMTAHARLASNGIQAVADMCGVGVVHVETNVRALRHYPDDWMHLGGAVLAGVALLVRGLYKRVFVASDSTWNGCVAAHEHPMLHNLWRLPGFSVRCTMVSTPRVERIRMIGSAMPGALAHLRVCWDMAPFQLNCGKCEKCQRTLAAMEVFGMRELAAPAFASLDLDWNLISALRPDSLRRPYWQQIADAARTTGKSDLAERLDSMLLASRLAEILAKLEPYRKDLIGTTAWKKKDSRLRDRFFDALMELDPEWIWRKLHRHRHAWRDLMRSHLRAAGQGGWAALTRIRLTRLLKRAGSGG